MEATVRQKVLIDVVLPPTWTATRLSRLAVDTALVMGFALLVALCSQVVFRIPTTTVPITGQTFGVLLTGGALGSKRGGLSMMLYMLMGTAGLTVFAPVSSFLGERSAHFILPWSGTGVPVWELSSGGYIVGFCLAAYVVGLLAERGWDRRSTVPLAMFIGSVCIYLIGVSWLAVLIASEATVPGTGLTYYEAISGGSVLDKALKGGLYPFIGGDAIKLLLAASALPGAWALVNRVRGPRLR